MVCSGWQCPGHSRRTGFTWYGGAAGVEHTTQQGFNLGLGLVAGIAVGKLHAYALHAAVVGTGRGNPHHLGLHGNFLRFIHQRQQQEDLFTQLHFLVGRNENPPVFRKGM
jgi:hypothetical protein